MAKSAAGSYANALDDVAKSNNTIDLTFADIEKMDKFFNDSVIGYFTNPTIPEEKKIEVIEEISKSGNLQPHVANFLNILVDMKRFGMIKEIIKKFELVYNRSSGGLPWRSEAASSGKNYYVILSSNCRFKPESSLEKMGSDLPNTSPPNELGEREGRGFILVRAI